MKLVLINDRIYKYAARDPSAVGGAERQQWLLARALAKIGWSVTVGVGAELSNGARKSIDGVEFVGIGAGQGHILSAWCRFLKREQPAWWYWRCASHLLGPAVATAKIFMVRTIFSAGLDADVNPRLAPFNRSRWWPLYAWGLSWSDKIFVQHQGQLEALASHLRRKSFVVPSIAGESPATKPHAERAKYVAWVGQLKQAKRPDRLIELARKAPAIQFVVCGGPSNFMSPPGFSERIVEGLEKLPNVDYRGQVTAGEASEIIADAAILLSTSQDEGFPNTFLQAWLSGTPVVSLKVDPDHVLERKRLGVVPRSVEDAMAAIYRLASSPCEREAMGVRARRYVDENHSEKAVTSLFNGAVLRDAS